MSALLLVMSIYKAIYDSVPFVKQFPKISGVNQDEVQMLSELLQKNNVDLKGYTMEYTDSPIEKREIDRINAIVQSAYKFVIVAHTETKNKKMIFGVYVDKQKLEDSFIFSLNHKTIMPIDRPQMTWEINPRTDSGPKFGKSDLQFFVFRSGGYDSMSNLCYNYNCPSGIEYGTTKANEYLAGSEIFTTLSFTILVDNSGNGL